MRSRSVMVTMLMMMMQVQMYCQYNLDIPVTANATLAGYSLVISGKKLESFALGSTMSVSFSGVDTARFSLWVRCRPFLSSLPLGHISFRCDAHVVCTQGGIDGTSGKIRMEGQLSSSLVLPIGYSGYVLFIWLFSSLKASCLTAAVMFKLDLCAHEDQAELCVDADGRRCRYALPERVCRDQQEHRVLSGE